MSDIKSDPTPNRGEAMMLTGIVVSPGSHHASRPTDPRPSVVARMAATMVRRQCNQHACEGPLTGSCAHANHRRDADYLNFCLTALGLPQDLEPVTGEDRASLFASLGNQEVETLPVEPISD